MKKLYIVTLLSIMTGTVCADGPDLTNVTQAIDVLDIDRVRRLWRKIERSCSLEERKAALDTLITIADEKKSTIVKSGKDVPKLVLGGSLFAVGARALFLSWIFGTIGSFRPHGSRRRESPYPYEMTCLMVNGASAALFWGGKYIF